MRELAYLTPFDVTTYNRPLLFKRYLDSNIYYVRTLIGYRNNPYKIPGVHNYQEGRTLKGNTLNIANRVKLGCPRQSGDYILRGLAMEVLIGLYTKKLLEENVVVLNPAGALGAKMFKKRVIIDLMDFFTCTNSEIKIPEIDFIALRKVDGVIAWSKAIANILKKRFNIKNVYYLPYGIVLENFNPPKIGAKLFFERYPELEGKSLIGYSGGMWFVGGKDVLGVEKIIKAFSKVEKEDRDAYLVLQTHPLAKQLVRKYGISRYVLVERTPTYNHELRQSMFSALNVFVLTASRYPSVYFAERSTMFQAMASKVAIVAEATPGTTGVLRHRSTALLAKIDDVSKLTENILLLLQDKDLALKLARNARYEVEEYYDWKKLGQKLRDLFANFEIG